MLKCGITGFNGNLGKNFIKENKKFYYIRFRGDLRKKKEVDHWIKKNNFDLIIHFASIVPIQLVNKNFSKAVNVNFEGTKHLVDAIIKYKKKIKWFFFSSTSHVYQYNKYKINENYHTKPISKYGKTKLLAEKYIKKKFLKNKIKFCIGRIFSIIDNKDKYFLTEGLIKRIKKKEKITLLVNLSHYRDFLTTQEISKIIFFLWKRRLIGIINIGSGIKTNLQSIAKIIAKKFNKKILFKNDKLTTHLIADIKKLKKLGYKPKKLNFVRFFYKK